MPNLAQTTHQTGVQDNLAAVDSYTQVSAEAPIDASAAPNGDASDLAGFLGLNKASVDAAVAATTTSIPTLTSKDISAAVLEATPDLQSSYSKLDTSLQQQITMVQGPTLPLSSIVDTTSVGLPSLTSSLSAKNLSSLSGMLDVVGKQASSSLSVTATSAQAVFMSNLLKVSVSAGIPNAYARIDAGNLGAAVMSHVTKTALSVAVSTSNLNLLANLSNGSMAASIKGISPGFTSAFAANFKLSANVSPSGHVQIGADIASALGKIDANWSNKPNAAGNSLVNANLFLNASKDFQTVMKAAVTFSRKPLATTTTVNVNVAASLLPSLAALSPATVARSQPSPYGQTQSFAFNNGETHTYVPNQDGTYTQTVVTPTSPTSQQLAGLDNSAITDPLALSGVYGQCVAQSSTSAISKGLADPSLDASSSIAAMFPLAYTGDLVNLG